MSLETDRIINGDCMDVMSEFPEESIHAVVCDPPYGLNFMPDVTNGWDDFEPKEYQEWCEQWAKEVLRVLKPGGHLLAFSGNRTHHRLFTGVEDAGFEIRDTLTWHYGSGFPKASDISKTIDRREDADREVVSENPNKRTSDSDKFNSENRVVDHTEPATPEAETWDGWKTGLKPATEYVVMARKPFDGATVDCVLEHGTGALNIDGTRIGTEERQNVPPGENDIYQQAEGGHGTVEGRYPSNVVFDATEAERLDNEVGELETGELKEDSHTRSGGLYNGGFGEGFEHDGYNATTGGPSRYFYTSKASKAERTENGKIENSHPTVKPQDLMEWLVKLVTREGQIVLDPFCGSGTTLKACKELNREFMGIEQQTQWADVARVRVGLTPNDPSVVRDDDNQEGLEAYE